jgi:hypothetical protein
MIFRILEDQYGQKLKEAKLAGAADQRFMQLALALGRRGLGRTWPNPAVGAVVVKDGVALRAQQVHPRPRRLARDRDRLVAGGADPVVCRYRQLEDHMRALVADAAKVASMVAGGFLGARADVDRDPGSAQFGVALPGHFGIGVLDRRHHARNA